MPLNLSNRDQNSDHNDPQAVKVFGRTSAAQLPPGRGLLVANNGAMEGVLVGAPLAVTPGSGSMGVTGLSADGPDGAETL